MAGWDGLNRRKFPRVSYPCLIKLSDVSSRKEVLLAHTENLGEAGVCLILKKTLKLLTVIDVEMDLMDTQDHIVCKGKIVWIAQRKKEDK